MPQRNPDDTVPGGNRPDPNSAANNISLRDAVAQLYRTALGRDPSQQEIDNQISGGSGDLATIQQSIYGSPEAQAFSARQTASSQPPPTTPPPGTPPPAGGQPPPSALPPPTNIPPPVDTSPGHNAPPTVGPAPTFTPTSYRPPPAFAPPPAFSYADFVAPNPNDLQNDPSYLFNLQQQQNAISHSATARGVLNTGGTVNDLMSNASGLASQGYHDLYSRNLQTYDTNRAGAFDAYKTNYGISKDTYDTNNQSQYVDPFKFNYQGGLDSYNSQIHNFDQSQYYAQHNFDQNLATQTHNSDLNRQYDWYQQLFGHQVSQDEWERKFRLLGLI